MEQTALINIINECKNGNSKNFRLIVDDYQSLVYQVSFRMLCDENDAKDIVQETFIRIWENIEAFDFRSKFSTWIYKIATNLCLDYLKHSHRKMIKESVNEQIMQLSTTENFDKKLENSEIEQIIYHLTEELSPKQKAVFVLHYFEEQETSEIQNITGLSAEKIKSNLYVAKQNIMKKLKLLNYE